MVDILLQIGAAKLVVSAALAGLAWVVQRRVGHPAVVHPLWLMVLVVMLLPAVVAIPVLPGKSGAARVIVGDTVVVSASATQPDIGATSRESTGPGTPHPGLITANGKAALAIVWLGVAAVLLGWTLVRALSFRRWLVRSSRAAPRELRQEAAEIGHRLGLVRMPQLCTVTARVSPMVCWTGGRVRLVVPSFLLESLDRQELRAVLAHELAHVRRRDHLVRWIEWLACSSFWWNPVAWWARREMRAAEEASCDALGAAAVESGPRAYARSLLGALEAMSTRPRFSAPAFASGVTSGQSSDSLEKRLRMLATHRPGDRTPRWFRPAVAVVALCLLPLGLVYCGTANQTSTEVVEESRLPPSGTNMVVLPGRNRPDSTEMKELWGRAPVYAYWIFAASGYVGPYALADAPVQPVECRLAPEEPDEDVRDESMATCARAMSRDLRGTGVSDDRNVCVVWGSKSRGWRGICESWEPEERHRFRGNGSGSVLLEPIAIAGSGR